MPGVKTVSCDQQENLSLVGSAPRPIPDYYTLSFNNDPNFMLTPDPDGGFPETPGYIDGIIEPDPTLVAIIDDTEYDEPGNPGTILEIPLVQNPDFYVDPSDNTVLQIALRKGAGEHVLNQIVNRIAVYTADDILIYIAHFLPTYWGESKIDTYYRHQYLSSTTLDAIAVGDIDKIVLADARIEAIAENIAKLQGLMVDHTVGSGLQVNQIEATDPISDLNTLSGQVHILEGDHEVGTQTVTDVELSRHSSGNMDLIGKRASGTIEITNNNNIDLDTFQVNGVDFVEDTDFTKGVTKELSAEALKDAINSSVDPLLSDITASLLGSVITTLVGTVGTAGNSATLAYTDSGSGISAVISGSTFTGGTDYSVLTLANTIKGSIKVINAVNDSVLITGANSVLDIETDNDSCVDLSLLQGIAIVNGRIFKGIAATEDKELIRKKEHDDDITSANNSISAVNDKISATATSSDRVPALSEMNSAISAVDDKISATASSGDRVLAASEVNTLFADLLDSAPATLDTLNELAAALGDDPNFATTITNLIATKAPIASPTFTGTVSGITAAMVGLGNVTNESKATMFTSPVFTGNAEFQGDVGIGTSTPGSLVSVEWSEDALSTSKALSLRNINAGTGAGTRLFLGNDATPTALDIQMWGQNHATLPDYARILNQRNGPLQLGANGALHVTILGNGNFGIGTADPQANVDLFDDGSATYEALRLTWEHLTATTGIEQRIVSYMGDDATPDSQTIAGYISFAKTGAWGTGATRHADVVIGTTLANVVSEVARFKSNGNVQLINYVAGISQFDASGNITSSNTVPTLGVGLAGQPSVGLDVISSNGMLLFGSTEADETDKNVRIFSRQWDSDEPGFTMLYTLGDAAYNNLNIGGGNALANAATDIYFYTGANNTTSPGTEQMHIHPDGLIQVTSKVFINETINSDMTYGLTINQGAADDEILTLRSSDVSQGSTSITNEYSFGIFKKYDGPTGGMQITGFSEYKAGLILQGFSDTIDSGDSNSSNGALELIGGFTNGTPVSSGNNLIAMRNASTTVWLIKGNGAIHAAVIATPTQLDDYDDVLLTRAAGAMLSKDAEQYKSMHPEMVTQLKTLGIINQEGSLYNQQRMVNLNLGTDGQLFNITKGLLNILTNLVQRFNITSSELHEMSKHNYGDDYILKMAKNYAA